MAQVSRLDHVVIEARQKGAMTISSCPQPVRAR